MKRDHLPNDIVRERLVMLAADIDDATAEVIAAVADMVREAGALDVTTIPVGMKKGRVGTRIEVLCTPKDSDALVALLLRESTTLGVRRTEVERLALPRREDRVRIHGHDIRIKVALWDGAQLKAKPEFDDCLAVAKATHRTVRDVLAEAIQAWQRDQSPTTNDDV